MEAETKDFFAKNTKKVQPSLAQNVFSIPMKILLLILLLSVLGFAEKKPLVLSLSGGGARGFAHIGVLKYLEKAGIVPDTVIGTSMGAVVGALYASGYSADEIYEILKDLSNTSSVFQKTLGGFGRRTQQTTIFNFQVDRNLNLISSGGIMSFQVLDRVIASKFISAQMASRGDFDRLFVPLRIVTTDVVSGEPVVHKSGDIFRTVKASASVPGIFAPVRIGDSWHVDGGLRANIPLSDTVRSDGDFVLAIDVTSKDDEVVRISSTFDVVRLLMTVGLDEAKYRNANLADAVISPLEGINVQNYHFHRFSEIVHLGYDAAKKSLAALPETDIFRGNARQTERFDDGFFAKAVRIEGLKRGNGRYLQRILDFDFDEKISTRQIARITNTVNRMSIFDDFYITGSNDTLVAVAEEKNLFNLGLGLRVDNRNLVEVLAAPVFNNIFGIGLSHGWEFQIGYLRKRIVSDLLWQVPLRGGVAFSAEASGYLSSQRLVTREIRRTGNQIFNDKRSDFDVIYYSEYDIIKNGLNLVGGFDFANALSFFGGVRLEYYRSRRSASGDVAFDFANRANRIVMFFAGIRADNKNDIYFPSRGGEHAFWFSGTNREFGSLENFFTLNALTSVVIQISDLHTLTPLLFGTLADQTLPAVMRYYIGGFRRESFISPSNILYTVPFAGVPDRGLSADNFFMMRLIWTYQFTKKYPLYFSILLDGGNLWNYRSPLEREIEQESGRSSPSFFEDIPVGLETELALKTPIGPIRFSWSRLIHGRFQDNFNQERQNIFKFSAGFDF